MENEVEVYRLTQDKQYCRDYAHTDCIEFVDGTMQTGIDKAYIARLYKNENVLLDEVMDYEEYESRVNANCYGYTQEEFGDVPIRVIVIE